MSNKTQYNTDDYGAPNLLDDLEAGKDIVILTTLIVLIVGVICASYERFPDEYAKFDSTSFVLSTLISLVPIIFIWYNQKKNQWIRDLPNFLNIEYLDNDDNLVAEFNYIPLAALADARSQAQSIFQTFNNNQRADLAPMLHEFKPKGIQIDKKTKDKLNDGDPFELHQASIKLHKAITEQAARDIYNLKDVQTIYWEYPFKKDQIKACYQGEQNYRNLEALKTDAPNLADFSQQTQCTTEND